MDPHTSKAQDHRMKWVRICGLLAGIALAALAAWLLWGAPASPSAPELTPEPTAVPTATPLPTPSPTPFVETDEMRYEQAMALLDEKRFDEAIAAFEALGGYADSEALAFETRLARATALCDEGRGFEAATEIYQLYLSTGDTRAWDCCFAFWERVTQRETVSAGVNYTVGVRSDGTVLATGLN